MSSIHFAARKRVCNLATHDVGELDALRGFASLLLMRERRDDRWCAKKYGTDWERYRERVPWRIIPRVY